MEYSNFKSLLNSRKVTLKSIAVELGMSHQNLSKLIQEKKITEERISILCDLLSISPNEFFGWKEEIPVHGSGNFASHVYGGNTQNSNESIKALNNQLKEKDKQIDRLLKIIEKNQLK